jgi:hypothetical protein
MSETKGCTDLELANKYFDEECKHSYADNEEQLKEDVISAFLKGLEIGKEEWHRSENELPEDTSKLYLVRFYSWDFGFSDLYDKYGPYIPTVCRWDGEHFIALDDMASYNARNIKNCVTWKEIIL